MTKKITGTFSLRNVAPVILCPYLILRLWKKYAVSFTVLALLSLPEQTTG
jgi:hypothetical protein